MSDTYRILLADDHVLVAEGIQNEEQRVTLLKLGCETGQGFLFFKPMAADAAERALAFEISAVKLALA